MEPNKKVGTILIITALLTLFNPVESERVPLINSFVSRSSLHVFPPSNTGSPGNSPANHPSQKKPVAPSPRDPSISPGKTLNQTQQLLPLEFKNICARARFALLCESSIQPLITGRTKPNPESVLLLLINASIEATNTALVSVQKLAYAADCEELYGGAVTNLGDAVNAVKSRDRGTVKSKLRAVITEYGTCNDGFEEMGKTNPLADVGDKLTKMASNCLAISSMFM